MAADIARSDLNLINSDSAIVAMMIYGAVGFYLGIDLPSAPEESRGSPPRAFGSKVDAVELLSAAGTFFTAVAAVIAVSSIILNEIARSGIAMIVLLGWASGASMQIAAGAIARLRDVPIQSFVGKPSWRWPKRTRPSAVHHIWRRPIRRD